MSVTFRICLLQTMFMLVAGSAVSAQARNSPSLSQGGGQSPQLRVATPDAAVASKRRIFVCHGTAVREFADRPCGSLSVARELQVTTTPKPSGLRSARVDIPTGPDPAAAGRAMARPHDTAEPKPAATPVGPREQCKELQTQVADIDQRMRAGYSAREAAKLWQRWHDAKDRLHRAGC